MGSKDHWGGDDVGVGLIDLQESQFHLILHPLISLEFDQLQPTESEHQRFIGHLHCLTVLVDRQHYLC